MDQTHRQKLLINLASLHKMASAWAMVAGGTMGTLWLSISDADRAAIVAHLPVPVWLAPVIVTAAGLAARAWPQRGITRSEALAKAADVPQPAASTASKDTP